ncbi:MAG: HEAT repeat domain-containing protein [Candidatus Wallbacteria bacterium]|nr:HEAT repeat domain-containing protein [Candidatus Wallbacteria bacterium]
MLFLVNIPYRESKNRNKRYYVEYEIRAESTEEALDAAKKKFNNYEQYNFASWERFMFEEEVEISPLLNGNVFQIEKYQDFIPLYSGFKEEEKLFYLNQLSKLKKEDKCILFYDFLLKDQSPRIKSFIISLVGRNDCHEDHDKLIQFLDDPDARVRANTIEALENFGVKELIPEFISLLADENNRVRANAIKALWKLGEKNLETHIVKMLKSYNSLMKSSALYVLGEIDFPGAVDMIIKFMKDDDELVRFNAGRSLLKIIRFEDLEKIIPYLGDPDDIIKVYVKKCFLKFNGEAVSLLVKSVEEEDGLPWNEINEILREIGEERLKSGDRWGFFKIMLKRAFHYLRR